MFDNYITVTADDLVLRYNPTTRQTFADFYGSAGDDFVTFDVTREDMLARFGRVYHVKVFMGAGNDSFAPVVGFDQTIRWDAYGDNPQLQGQRFNEPAIGPRFAGGDDLIEVVASRAHAIQYKSGDGEDIYRFHPSDYANSPAPQLFVNPDHDKVLVPCDEFRFVVERVSWLEVEGGPQASGVVRSITARFFADNPVTNGARGEFLIGYDRGERDSREPVELEWAGGAQGAVNSRAAAHDYLMDQMESGGWLIAI